MKSPFLCEEIYRFGLEFSLSWLETLGFSELPKDIENRLGVLVDEMQEKAQPILHELIERSKR